MHISTPDSMGWNLRPRTTQSVNVLTELLLFYQVLYENDVVFGTFYEDHMNHNSRIKTTLDSFHICIKLRPPNSQSYLVK